MVALITDPVLERRMIAQRKATGVDRYDEVWDGVYVMAPMASPEHQDIVGELTAILTVVVSWTGLGRVHPCTNVSSQRVHWEKDYRVPDVAVFLNDNQAAVCGTHWFGGPDLAVEVVSRGDRSFEKLPFYASVNTREVLIIDRDPWELVLFRNQDGTMLEVGRSTAASAGVLNCETVPLSFQLLFDENAKPRMEVRHSDGQQQWTITAAK